MQKQNDLMQEIQSLGELQFTIEEICIIKDIDINDFSKEHERSYNRGRLMASAEVRKEILKQAKNGSTPAQKQMLELIESASFDYEQD